MNAEILAKLALKAAQLDISGRGGKSEIDRLDVAGALVGTHRIGYLLLLAKYAGDNDAMNLMWQELADHIQVERECRPDIAKGVALAAAFYVINPCLCPACGGRKVIYPRLKGKTVAEAARDCDVCNMTGMGKVSGRQRASMAQIPTSTWFDRWEDYAIKKEQWLFRLESSSLDKLKRALRRDDDTACIPGQIRL